MAKPVHRLFIGLAPDQETCQALVRLRARVAPHIDEIRWTPPENWHITLHFLGACNAEQAAGLTAQLPNQAEGFTPLSLAGSQLQGFPHPQRPGRIWALTLESSPTLRDWHARLGHWLEAMGHAVERRSLKAHITLARSGRARHWPMRETPLMCRFDKLALFESVSTPQGPRYQSLSAVGTSA
ncbi:RNA 2',3'-cyclic phosphodiesterase [Phytohalomonas tamaricis]|uniref:RNA 2',3'-cyclic phosphodiesterase n=1 Tax=Phytohalomonas tamaricis TaxID=2081032 RepID=UPI000D0B43AF|nr:RNA 2',3'-cyclic phosphodiesterase [Phytohalomonas tamaricis]